MHLFEIIVKGRWQWYREPLDIQNRPETSRVCGGESGQSRAEERGIGAYVLGRIVRQRPRGTTAHTEYNRLGVQPIRFMSRNHGYYTRL